MTDSTIVLNGHRAAFSEGETLLDIARREGCYIPTLCSDSRLEPSGACRACLVEIEGQRRMAPACATIARSDMVVATRSERIDRHRKLLAALYLTDHVRDRDACETGARCELHDMAATVAAPTDWPSFDTTRADRPNDRNRYVEYRADRCILCARCVRYCEEVEGVSAIALTGRGHRTTISTVDGVSLMDSTCELCGGCVATCPTGAMTEKKPLTAGSRPEGQLRKVRTTCAYCGVGCEIDLNVDPDARGGLGRVVKVTSPPAGTPPNDGNLCVKGRFAYDFIDHPDRLTAPLVRAQDGRLLETSWDEALQRAASGLLGVRDRHGADALGFVSSSRCTGEENYLVQKLSRAVFGTNNVHQCAAT